jgi:ABC-type amino acid transport system permease subunit
LSDHIIAKENVPSMAEASQPTAGAFFNDPDIRGYAYQALLIAILVVLIFGAAHNAYVNMEARGIPLGFGFWDQTAGFDINQKLIAYTPLSTYGRAFWVGLLNTLLVAALGIVLATPLGFIIGRACRRIGSCRKRRWSMSRSCATRRCCCNSCSGTTLSSKLSPAHVNRFPLGESSS